MTTANDDVVMRIAAAVAGHDKLERISPRVVLARDVAIKVYGENETRMADAELALLVRAHLRCDKSVVRTQIPLHHDDNVREGRRVLVTWWDFGAKRTYDEIDDDTWAALGRALADLHDGLDDGDDENRCALPDLVAVVRDRDLAAERARIVDDRRSFSGKGLDAYFDARLKLLDEYGPWAQELLAGFEGVPPLQMRRSALHNDYNEHNYLFDVGAAQPPMILDFDRAVFGPREFEIVRCLNHLPIAAPARARRFIEGYRAVAAWKPEPFAVEWSVAAAFTAHAVKHWPLEKLAANESGARELIDGMAAMTLTIEAHSAELKRFFRHEVQWEHR